jgi:REP element-mobilizing transposase RayT
VDCARDFSVCFPEIYTFTLLTYRFIPNYGTPLFFVARRQRLFHIDAWVVLPNYLHCVWTLPLGDDDFSNCWKAIKSRCVQALPRTEWR